MGKTLGIGFAAIVILVAVAFLFIGSEAEQTSPAAAPEQPTSKGALVRKQVLRDLPAPPEDMVETYQLSGTLPSLDNSDQALFKHLAFLFSSARLGLLKQEQFIRKFVLQIDNAAQGDLVYQHSPIVEPDKPFQANQQGNAMDPASYARYDSYGDLVESVDTSLLVAFYSFYEPLLDQAYMELGYPEGRFRTVLIAAIDQALATPVVSGEIKLEQPEANYIFADQALESLNMLQKQLLRMGPENTAKIQAALQSFKARIQ